MIETPPIAFSIRRLPQLIAVAAGFVALLMTAAGALRPGRAIAIVHVDLIDATGAPTRPDMTVLLRDRRILRVERSSALGLPAGAEVVDGKGKWLLGDR